MSQEKYNPELKWGAPTSSYEDAKAISKLVQKNKDEKAEGNKD